MWRRPVGEVGVKRRYGAMTAGEVQVEEECFLAVALLFALPVGGDFPEEAQQLQIAGALIAAELVDARIDRTVVKSVRGRPLMFEDVKTEEAWNDFRFRKEDVGRLFAVLQFPDVWVCRNKSRFPGETALLLLLRRLSPLSLLIFHRHGDRSPLKGHTPDEVLSLSEGCGNGGSNTTRGLRGVAEVATEAKSTAEVFWKRELVPREDVRRLDVLFPVWSWPSGEEEAVLPPDEVSAPFGCLTSLGLQQLRDRGRRLRQRYSVDDVTRTRMEVFSTNYRRTQLSAQGFLDGFRDGEGGVPVVVRPRSEDFLNQWESQGSDMYELMMSVESGSSFRETDEAVGGPLKRQLHALDPALFPLPLGGRFRWMMAADYFMSARARGLRIPPELDNLGTATIRHLTWRFGRFYRDERMMRIMVGPLLAHILECAAESGIEYDGEAGRGRNVSFEGGGSLSRVVSSSCHDVTVLALLYAMEAHLLDDPDYWPPYGSTIAFAVSRYRQALRPGRGEEGLVLAITVDEKPLRSRLFEGTEGAVPLSDFRTAMQRFLPR